MAFSSKFYNKKKQNSASSYSLSPPGQFVVHRLLRNLPFWRKNINASTEIKKTLVLANDWTSSSWQYSTNNYKLDILIKKLGQLIDNGFDIYIWIDNKAKKLTKSDVSALRGYRSNYIDNHHGITLVNHDIIIAKMIKKNKLMRDDILILDDYWMQSLIKDKYNQPYEVTIEDLMTIPHSEREKMISYFKNGSGALPKICQFVDMEYGQNDEKPMLLKHLHESLPDVLIKPSYITLQLNLSELAELLINEKLTINEKSFLISQLENIEKFNVLTDADSMENKQQVLHAALSLMPKLNSLMLDLDIMEPLDEAFAGIDLSKLRTLNLINMPDNNLVLILKKTPHLKELRISDVNLSENDLRNVSLNELERLDISLQHYPSETITIEHFYALLSKTKNLKQLNCYRFKLLDDVPEYSNLSELEVADFFEMDLSMRTLHKLTMKSKKLKSLHFTSCQLLDDVDSDLNYSEVETLILTNMNIDAALLVKILKSTKKLKYLNLSGCNIAGELSEALALQDLISVNLQSMTISANNFTKLFMNASNMEELNLKYAHILEDETDEPLYLFHLKDFSFEKGNASAKNIQNIFMFAEHLENISLKTPRIEGDITTNFIFDSIVSAHIDGRNVSDQTIHCLLDGMAHSNSHRVITLNKLDIDATYLNNIFLKSKELEEISFSHVRIAGSLSDIKLENLNSISMSNVKLDKKSFHNLLKSAKHLESFVLSTLKSDTIGYELPDDMAIPTLKRLSLNCPLSAVVLGRFLAGVHQLEHLEINTDVLEGEFVQRLYLPNLNCLEISSIIQVDILQRLIIASPHITTLTLSYSTINGRFNDLLNLKSLTKLILTDTNIETENLISLILASPQLKVIDMIDIQGVNFDDPQLKELVRERHTQLIRHRSHNYESSEHTSNPPILSDPVHTPASTLSNQGVKNDFKFEFKGENKSLDQSMIVEKLSQYITLMKKNDFVSEYLEHLNSIQVGICLALARIFESMETKQWEIFLNDIAEWDGQKNTLNNDNIIAFNLLLLEFKKTYLQPDNTWNTFLGSNLPDFILNSRQEKMVFSNPWHAITVKSLASEDLWQIYDSCYPGGYKVVAFDELIVLINRSLGNLVSVEGDFAKYIPKIKNPSQFINEGGLLVLVGAQTFDQAETYCALLPAYNQFSLAELKQGLLLRTEQGHPAWKLGLESKYSVVKEYVKKLIKMLAEQDPKHFAEVLANSIAHLPNKEKFFAISSLIETEKITKVDEVSLIELMEAVNTKQVMNESLDKFETWKSVRHEHHSTKAYYKNLVNGSHKKRLIELSSSEHVDAMALALQHHCLNINRPFFYIHSPEDLVCSAPYIEKTGNKGEIKVGKNGQGGLLHDFLMAHNDKANPPILIVNYDRFEAADIVNFNSLLDKIPKADGTPLPENASVIGLINPDKPNCYRGEDFYSRFGVGNIETCPFKTEDILPPLPPILEKNLDHKSSFVIDFFHAADWQERLLGRWIIKKDQLYFEEGILSQALASGLPINIRNGLWENSDFKYFWQRARTLGYIESYGKHYNLSNITLSKSDGYDWAQLKSFVSFDGELHDHAETLNPTRFSEFFNQYKCDNTKKQMDTLDGIIAAHAGQQLHVNLTRSLSEDEWAILLKSCEKYRVKLNCHCAVGVKLPGVLGVTPTPISPLFSNVVMQSTDVDVTIAQLNQNHGYIVIDVSELNYDDLLIKITGKMDKKNCIFEFTQKDGVLKKALDQNQSIILKGKFSSELADTLASLVLEYQKNGKGQLKIITEDAANFSYANIIQREVTSEEKYHILASEFRLDLINQLNDLHTTPLCKLRARLQRPQLDPWQGMLGLSGGIKLNEFDEHKSAKRSKQFKEDRMIMIWHILQSSPFCFIAGLTGVGKSTFVERYLNTERSKVFKSESNLREWATSEFPRLKILFIDEANLSASDWSMFEGLFNRPPGIVIDGTYYELTDNHVVIFAGNPFNYRGERKMATLFERHGNAMVFYPMPLEFIYEEVLKPVFASTSIAEHTLSISKEILKVYQFLCEASNEEVLISPREVQMMALLALSYLEKNPLHDPIKVAQHFAHLIAQPLVPESHKSAFNTQFKDPIKRRAIDYPENFVLTHSRGGLYQHLNDLVALREYRRAHPELNEAQLYGGLGGLIIQGEPGIGKSEIVIANLLNNKYQQVFIDTEIVPENAFYFMPISMEKEEKEKLLLKAFHEGAIVIVDEINSAPMMERLLNELLMGKTPNGERPTRPGFMIIGTQNPETMSGRIEISQPLKRRVTTIDLPPYTASELKWILLDRGVELSYAKGMIKAFHNKTRYAIQHQLKPIPTVRDLINLADERIRLVGKVVQSETDIKLYKPNKYQDSFFSNKSNLPKKEDTPVNQLSADKIVK